MGTFCSNIRITKKTLIRHQEYFLCFVDRACRYNRVKENQLDAQFILGIFRESLYVSVVSRPIIRRYNPMYKTIGNYSSS